MRVGNLRTKLVLCAIALSLPLLPGVPGSAHVVRSHVLAGAGYYTTDLQIRANLAIVASEEAQDGAGDLDGDHFRVTCVSVRDVGLTAHETTITAESDEGRSYAFRIESRPEDSQFSILSNIAGGIEPCEFYGAPYGEGEGTFVFTP